MASSSSASCVDNEALLKLMQVDDNATCNNTRSYICAIDIGIKACPATCGYCPPFSYRHVKDFVKPMITILPIMAHQTRFSKTDCHGFGEVYERQPSNQDLYLFPALDGERQGRVLTCIDRSSHEEGQYGHHVECPPTGMPEGRCTDGHMHITHKHTYHGQTVYPRMLFEPKKDIDAMKAVNWLDLQTDELTVSTLIYTEGVEIFTSVSLTFTMDLAGNIHVRNKMISYRDLINNAKIWFITLLTLVMLGSLLNIFLSIVQMKRDPECRCTSQIFELVTRSGLCAYCMILLITWSQQLPMSKEYDDLLHTLLDFHGADFEAAIQRYFDVKTIIWSETQWLMKHRLVSYVVCYVQFIQLMLYFGVHPRMGVLTLTVYRALSQLVHFAIVFLCIFLMLAFMAHWMLGGQIKEFLSFDAAVKSQARMLFGEFIHAENAGELDGAMEAMYWIYALTFMIVIFFLLLNFFLAIVVDAFIKVQQDERDDVTEMTFGSDIVDVVKTRIAYTRHGWPSQLEVLKTLNSYIQSQIDFEKSQSTFQDEVLEIEKELLNSGEEIKTRTKCEPSELMELFPVAFADEERLSIFLLYYFRKCKYILSSREDSKTTPEDKAQPEKRASSSGLVLADGSSETDWKFEGAVCAPARLLRPLGHGEQNIDWDVEALMLARRILQEVKQRRAAQPASQSQTCQGSQPALDALALPPPQAPSCDHEMSTLERGELSTPANEVPTL